MNPPNSSPDLHDAVLRRDQFRLRRERDRLREQKLRGNDVAAAEAALADRIAASAALRAARAASVPKISYPEELPISANREQIRKAIEQHPVVIVCGETGSGKTTQLPKICLEAGRGIAGAIGHTQPRRIAARAVAARIAEELGVALGQLVGYKLRFQDRTSPQGLIKLMTDGILLAETQGDRFLDNYDTLIVDEAHERSLNIDFLLGYLKWLLPKRPDLKVVITSATIDPERFSKHFNDAPIINVSGRSYPVEMRYRAVLLDEEDETAVDEQEAILAAVDELWREQSGDILVFLSGEREIRETAESLRKHHPTALRSVAAVFAPGAGRAATRVQAIGPAAHRARHQRGRDLADRARHPRRHRHRRGAHQPLQPSQPAAAPAHREDLAGVRQPALGPLRSRGSGRCDSPVLRRGLPRAPRIHRA